MTKEDLIRTVSYDTSVSNADTRAVVERTIETIQSALAKGETLYLRGFGTFSPKTRKAKTARDISKGTTIVVPERVVPHFKASKSFIEKLAK